MNILVTGGAGFIGSHVYKTLAQRGFTPVVYDNLSRGHRHAVKWGPLEVGSLADSERVRAALAKFDPAAVMHLRPLSMSGSRLRSRLSITKIMSQAAPRC